MHKEALIEILNTSIRVREPYETFEKLNKELLIDEILKNVEHVKSSDFYFSMCETHKDNFLKCYVVDMLRLGMAITQTKHA